MSDITYEGMFLLDSNKYASNPDGTSGEVLAILERAGAKVLAHRPWQDGKLAYLIDGHRKAMYFLTYFSLNTQHLSEVTRLCKFNDHILRTLFIKLDPALVEPMLAMASGRGDVVSTFKDADADATGTGGDGPRHGRDREHRASGSERREAAPSA